ncbi:Hypothetical protein A7A1_2673 [Bacillus subtilis subsp. subtilis str. BSP1]|nr:Hypothetical protein A7A1_2673 [Bacillus subtilis subsp. subtilis str. BSP1]
MPKLMSPFYIHSVYDDLESVVWMYTSGTKHFFISLFFWPKRIFTPKKNWTLLLKTIRKNACWRIGQEVCSKLFEKCFSADLTDEKGLSVLYL